SLGLRNANAFNVPDRVNTPACANPINPNNPTQYIKTECFVAPPPLTYGNAGRNQYEGPRLHVFDLSLIKNTNIGEKVKLQFRAEAFNLFNWTNFAIPDRVSTQLFSFNSTTNAFSRVATAGALNSTSTTSRQIQFALKLSF